ncbi:MAG TPA: hypothetical protein VKA46_35200 [Gemmataceae bacterium]|nr:hypothetical protein [Gemmataceae bacterium]
MKPFRWAMIALGLLCLVLVIYGSVKLARSEAPPAGVQVDAGVAGVTATPVDPDLRTWGMTFVGVGILGVIASGAGLTLSFRRGGAV